MVETAWKLNVSKNLLNVRYDDTSQVFFVDNDFRRKDVTSAKGALNGYQKGKCFYCYDDITVSDDSTNTCDVDHFFRAPATIVLGYKSGRCMEPCFYLSKM